MVVTPCQMEKPAPSPRVAREARNAQKYVSRPYPNGCLASGGRLPRLSAMNRKTSVTVSATECAASDSIAEEWLIRPPMNLATAIARLASPATITVPVDSPSEPSSEPCPWTARSSVGCVMAAAVPRDGRAQPWCGSAPVGNGGGSRCREEWGPQGPATSDERASRDRGTAAGRGVVRSGARRVPRRATSGLTRPGNGCWSRCGPEDHSVIASPHSDEVDDEDQGRAGLDHAARAAIPVRLLRGDGQPPAATDLHAGDALVPALDHHAPAEPELQRVAAVPGGVELLTALVGDADVVRAHQAAGGRLRAVADDQVLDHEVVRGRSGGRVDVRSAQLGHGSPSCAGTLPAPSTIQAAARPGRRRGQTRSTSGDAGSATPPTSSGWAISSAGRRAARIAITASTGGTRPASTKVVVRPITSLTVPARAMDSGMKLSDTKKSRLDTRPSSAGGPRRCSSVPQMTMPAWKVAPMTAPAAIMTQSAAERPNTTSGTQPRPHSRFMTVR